METTKTIDWNNFTFQPWVLLCLCPLDICKSGHRSTLRHGWTSSSTYPFLYTLKRLLNFLNSSNHFQYSLKNLDLRLDRLSKYNNITAFQIPSKQSHLGFYSELPWLMAENSLLWEAIFPEYCLDQSHPGGDAKMNPSAWQADLIAFMRKKWETSKIAKSGPSSLCHKNNQVLRIFTRTLSVATLSLARGDSSEWLPQPFPSQWDVAEVPVKDTGLAHLQQHHLIVQHTWLLLVVGLYAAHKVWVSRIHPLHEHHQGMLARAEEDQQSIKPKHCQICNICSKNCFLTPQQFPGFWLQLGLSHHDQPCSAIRKTPVYIMSALTMLSALEAVQWHLQW